MRSFTYQFLSLPCLLALAATMCSGISLEAKSPAPNPVTSKNVMRDRARVEKKIQEITANYAGSIPDAPQVKIDSTGNAVAIWQEDGLNTLINASTSASLGGPWSAPVLLSDPTLNSSHPTLAMDAQGDAVALWLSGYPLLGCNALYAAILPSGGSWSAPVLLSTVDEAVFDDYTVDINASGQIVVIWNSFSIAQWDFSLFSATYDPIAQAWSAPQSIPQ